MDRMKTKYFTRKVTVKFRVPFDRLTKIFYISEWQHDHWLQIEIVKSFSEAKDFINKITKEA